MKRIGRPANPAERGLQLAHEDAEVLDAMAEQVYLEEGDEYTADAVERWNALPDEEREKWRARALELQREHVAQYVEPTDPDDPDPGMPRIPDDVVRTA